MAKNGESKAPPRGAPDAQKRKSRPPTSRLARLARLGALAPHALPVAIEGAKRVLGAKRSDEDEARARERMLADARKAASALLKTLGDMKGLPLKIGQMASYIDGIAPPGYEEKVQRALRSLQEKAPPLSAEAAAKVVSEDLGASPEKVFAQWQRDPFAAASIGQVHRACTHGGEDVAVKVQYPGIDKAIENDLKSLALLESFSSPLLRKYNTKETLDDVRQVFLAELDYRREATMADTFRRIHRDLPDIVVPRVNHSLSSRRVLTSEFIAGQTYQEFCQSASQEERDAAAVTIWGFMFRSLFSYGILYADPHPGNYRFLGGAKVAFLDYGCVKVLSDTLIEGLKRYTIAAMEGDWAAFDRECVTVLGYDPSDAQAWKLYRNYSLALLQPTLTDEVFEWSPKVARETVAYLVRGHRDLMFVDGKKVPQLPKPIRPPAEATFLNRLQWGLASILGGLRARTRLRRVTEPWVRGPRRKLPA